MVDLLLLLLLRAAEAQARGCVERPAGPPVEATAVVRTPRGRAVVTLPPQPAHGHACGPADPPARDVLRGEPRPEGLLR